MVDGAHTFAEAEGAQDAGGAGGEADGGADEGYAEVGRGRHVKWGLWVRAGCAGGGGVVVTWRRA